MAEKLASPIGSLADGAERLERLIRGVKDRQFSEASNAPQPKSVASAFAVSPEEVWSKQFMTAGIGPNVFKPVQMPVVSIAAPAPAATMPMPAPKSLEPAIMAAKPGAESPGALRPTPIGAAIAKPARKRTWFGRLVKE
jgi:hypothetical protein